jgi:uracil-DNA glycosylase family 4
VLKRRSGAVIEASSPFQPLIAFVGASPSEFDALRGSLFSGPPGERLNEQYLEPLGILRKDCAFLTVVPVYLVDDKGSTRAPTDEECGEWKEELFKALDEIEPLVTVALGSQAKRVLGERADLRMPHPVSLLHFHKSEEMDRKPRLLRDLLTSRIERVQDTQLGQAADVSGAAVRLEKARVLKADDEKRLTYGPVLIPGERDAQGDIVTAEEVEAACHRYMERSRVIGEDHKRKIDSVPVECYCSLVEMTLPNQLTGKTEKYPKGTWFLAARHSPQKWAMIKRRGPEQGYSIGGFGERTAI